MAQTYLTEWLKELKRLAKIERLTMSMLFTELVCILIFTKI